MARCYWNVLCLLVFLRIQTTEEYRQRNYCTCSTLPLLTEYSLSDFVILGEPTLAVTSKDGSYKTYDIEDIHKYKVSSKAVNFFNEDIIKLIVTSEAKICGTDLTIGKRHLIFGNVKDSTASIFGACTNSGPWTNSLQDVILSIVSRYKSNFYCKVQTCSEGEACQEIAAENVCVLDTSKKNSDCYTKFSDCKFSNNGHCEWVSSPQLDECLEAA